MAAEWWGLTDQVKRHALKIAEAGPYRVLVPDIYKGKIGVDAEEAHHLMSNLDFPGAVAEIGAAADFLEAEGSSKIAVVGWCMGGALTLGALAKSPKIIAGAPFYGSNLGLFAPEDLKGKAVQGHFGREDTMAGFSDVAAAHALEEVVQANALPSSQIHIYDGVGHAFLNDQPAPYASFQERKDTIGFPVYNEDVATLAWGRLFAFLGANLKPNPEL